MVQGRVGGVEKEKLKPWVGEQDSVPSDFWLVGLPVDLVNVLQLQFLVDAHVTVCLADQRCLCIRCTFKATQKNVWNRVALTLLSQSLEVNEHLNLVEPLKDRVKPKPISSLKHQEHRLAQAQFVGQEGKRAETLGLALQFEEHLRNWLVEHEVARNAYPRNDLP